MLQTQLIYCGDNLQKLRELPDECIDLIYIDPPFNSNRNYEVFWGDAKEKRSFDDRFGAVEHYIHWMRPRVSELYRVLKKTGSFYYHCDNNANAYVRVLLDQQFSIGSFRTEIVWKRSASHGAATNFHDIHDTIYYYSKSKRFIWNPSLQPHSAEYIRSHYSTRDKDGRPYQLVSAHGAGQGPPRLFGEREIAPPTGRHWMDQSTIDRWMAEGRIVFTKTNMPRYKRYLDDTEGHQIGNVWDDIPPINSQAKEALGYPTQKPLPLLNRIIEASSNKGDVVLDAFCGCGTTLVSAQNLGRRWIGIDISPTACRVMAARLTENCMLREGKDFWVRDLPKTAEELRKYPPFEFENWAVNALNTVISNGHAIANKAQVGDMGIDGRIYPATMVKEKKTGYDLFGESDRWFPVQVKQKDKAGRPDIDSFETAMQRQNRDRGFFISFDFTSDAHKEIARAQREMNLFIVPITVAEILNEEVQYRV